MKDLLRELILPFFWLIVFITSSNERRGNKLKKADNTELKKQYISAKVNNNETSKTKGAIFINPVYLTGF